MRGEPIRVTDLGQMRAAMHPARWRVLTELFDRNEALTATQAAELTGLTPSAMSYHLHQLARAGYLERDDATDGRERPWRAKGAGLEISGRPDAAVGRAMMQNILAEITRLFTAEPPAGGEDRPWPASYTHTQLRLTRERAKELHRRIHEVIDEFEGDDDEKDGGPDAGSERGPEYDVFWIQGVRPDR